MNEIALRRARPEDGPHLPGLFEEAIRLIASRFYDRDQVNAWAARSHRLQTVFETGFNARFAWVAEDPAGQILAYIDLEAGGHIDFFYARPEVSRTPVTQGLYDLLEKEARSQGVKALTTEASEAAKRFFLRQGFLVTARQDVILSGVSIHNYRMRKTQTAL
jgi:putative acetyltransferase